MSTTTPTPPKPRCSWLGRVHIAAYCAVAFVLIACVVSLYTQDKQLEKTTTQQTQTGTPSPPPAQGGVTTNTSAQQVSINDNDTGEELWRVAYDGDWRYQSGSSGPYEGDQHFSWTSDDSATLRFAGSAVRIYGARAEDSGSAQVFIDDQFAGSIDSYAEQRTNAALLFTSATLSQGNHQLQVRVTGQDGAGGGSTVALDRFVVTTTTPPSPSSTSPTSTEGGQSPWDDTSTGDGNGNGDWSQPSQPGEGNGNGKGKGRGHNKWWKTNG